MILKMSRWIIIAFCLGVFLPNTFSYAQGVVKDVPEIRRDTGEVRRDIRQLQQDVFMLRQEVRELREEIRMLRQDVFSGYEADTVWEYVPHCFKGGETMRVKVRSV